MIETGTVIQGQISALHHASVPILFFSTSLNSELFNGFYVNASNIRYSCFESLPVCVGVLAVF